MFRSKAKRRQLIKRDGCKCHYCGKRLEFRVATVDHVKPKSKGGGNHNENLVLACRACNQEKADHDPTMPAPCFLAIQKRKKKKGSQP